MDRGAAFTPSPHPDPAALSEVVPPFEWKFARNVGLVGAALIAVAAVIGAAGAAIDGNFDPTPAWPGHIPRLFLVLFGALAAGAAVSMRPDRWQAWGVGAGAALLAVFGTPAHWDSFRLLFGAMTAIAVTWAVLLAAAPKYRLPVLTVLLLFHFSGIFFATTTPPNTPWVTEQAFMRVYNPYLQFVYLRNAYHFYSPEPGPASVLVFLLKTEVGRDPATNKPLYQTRWVVMPKRPADVKDPLGLTYYRYLSITEQVARGSAGLALPANYYEKAELVARRRQVFAIPLPRTDEELIGQYKLPHAEIHRYVIPSYASHVILEHTTPEEAKRTTVKMYRLEHSTMGVEDFINWRKSQYVNSNPYHPTTYRPYFLGEFNARGDLLDPQEPMLYWYIPIHPRLLPPGEREKGRRDFDDYMTFHALGAEGLGPTTRVDQLDEERFKALRFDWNQLR